MLNLSFRTKVDLTKYTEEHCFNFDRAFDERTSNEKVNILEMNKKNKKFISSITILSDLWLNAFSKELRSLVSPMDKLEAAKPSP